MPALSFAKRLRILWFAFIDRRTPLPLKVLVVLSVFYGISPLDVLPDFLPILGQMDDIGVLLFSFVLFYKGTTKIREHLRKNV